ncbi:MAG TPA: lipid-binding SYLF domain-containing protein [Terriglobia bacterium]|nr:lipid-binding SYLF domain-containing protein [Terriglobia bacterium]
MKKLVLAFFIISMVGYPADQKKALERVDTASTVLDEIMAAPDKGIPGDLLVKSECVAVIPSMKKGGFIFGGKYGVGVISCRVNNSRSWSAPSTIRIEGGSFGLQIGGAGTDVILLVMNARGAVKLMSSKFTLGGDASVAGGPVGREATAQTDAQMHAEMLSYSRSRGIFAGISLQGSTLRPDNDANKEIFGKEVAYKDILMGRVPAPPGTKVFLTTLAKYAGPKPSAKAAPRKGAKTPS